MLISKSVVLIALVVVGSGGTGLIVAHKKPHPKPPSYVSWVCTAAAEARSYRDKAREPATDVLWGELNGFRSCNNYGGKIVKVLAPVGNRKSPKGLVHLVAQMNGEREGAYTDGYTSQEALVSDP